MELTREELKERNRQRTQKSGQLFKRAQNVYPNGEISGARKFDPWPFYGVRGEGAYIWDVDGNRYLDCCMCFGVLLLGHRPEPVVTAIQRQLEYGLHLGTPGWNEVDYAEKLVRCIPCAEQVILCNTGNEAVQKAVTLARACSKRDKVAKFEGGFHGSNEYSYWSAFAVPELMGPLERPNPVAHAAGMTEAAKDMMVILPVDEVAAPKLIEEHAHELAVVMIEPVMGPGCLPVEKEFLQLIRQTCTKNNVLLLFDEVITGFRLALGGGQEAYGVLPDIGLFGKALGGGLPIGAIATSRKIIERTLEMDPPLSVAGTFSGNAMTLAASNAVLDFLIANNPKLYLDLEEKGDFLRFMFNEFCRLKGFPATMTGKGSMWQVNMLAPPVRRPRDLIREDHEKVTDFALKLRLEGIFLPSPLHIAFLSTAHTWKDVEEILRALKVTLEFCFS